MWAYGLVSVSHVNNIARHPPPSRFCQGGARLTLGHVLLIVSRWDRLMIFAVCNLAAVACFVICFALLPVLSMKPRKFVVL